MKIVIRPEGLKLSKLQRAQLQTRLELLLSRFAPRIPLVTARLSNARGIPGYKRCQLEVGVDAELVSTEHSDINVFLALEHAATRAARSVGRAIEKQSWMLR